MPKKKRAPRRLDRETKEGLERAERAVVELQGNSQQPRFDPKASDLFLSTMRWGKDAFEQVPNYATESRQRSKWLSKFWNSEPYIAGLINSVVQIDRNRGWSLVGGRNQVLRFTDILHNWQVQPGRASWREGVGAMAQAFYTTDMGGLCEVGRQFQNGPLAGMFHLDPTRCVLSAKPDMPLKYYPVRGNRIEFTPYDYMRVASAVNIDEGFNGLGYCALSRCVELAIIMVAIYRHEQEMLFARAPKGLLLLKGISEATWKNAMKVRDAILDSRQQEWFGAVAVLAGGGDYDVDAKIVALSQLPAGFDQQVFTDLLIYGYSLCFGYDPREFWPVSSGALGTATETEAQHRKATGKGGKEFCLGLQEELQGNLPDTLHFDFDERDVDGEISEAALHKAQIDVVAAMYGDMKVDPLLSKEQALTLLAEQGIIPREWTQIEEDVEATDTEDADAPDTANVGDIPGTDGTTQVPAQTAQQVLEYPEVRRAMAKFPDEPIMLYQYKNGRGRIKELSRKQPGEPVYSIARIMKGLAAEVEEEEQMKPRIIQTPAPAPVVSEQSILEKMQGWFKDKFNPQPVNVNITNQQPAVNVDVETQKREYPINVNPTPVTIENVVNVPTQPIPDVKVQVEPTAVTVNVPKQEAPVVNVAAPQITNQITPTPVTINVPKPPSKKVKIVRNKDGKIIGMEEEK